MTCQGAETGLFIALMSMLPELVEGIFSNLKAFINYSLMLERRHISPIHVGSRFRKVALKSRFIQKFRIMALIEPVALFLKSSLYSKF